MVLEIMHFFMMAFTLKNIFVYFVGLGILTYLITIDEGKVEQKKNISVYRAIYINKSDFCIDMDNFLKLPI